MRDFDFPGRSAVYGAKGAVATSHPLAVAAAMDILKAGGTAMDAGITAAAVLAVVEPQSTSIGGDCFALIGRRGSDKVIGFNGSGRAAKAATIAAYAERGVTKAIGRDVHAITLPGMVDGWVQLHKAHGRLPFAQLMQPAIGYARDGYVVHGRVAYDWAKSTQALAANPGSRSIFLKSDGSPYREGDIHRQPALAASLEALAEGGRDAFYQGPLAKAMVETLQSLGGLQTLDDFAAVSGEFVTPISSSYRGHQVHQIPPNNQGLTVLIMLNLLEGFDLAGMGAQSVLRNHLEIEAGRLAYAIRDRVIGDLPAMVERVEDLLSKERATAWRQAIQPDRRMTDLPDLRLKTNDTVYISVVDSEGQVVSFINSIFHSFGSAITCPKTGILFQNRGMSFRLDPKHPNALAPGKRPMHTIMPGMVTKGGTVTASYGVMGGDYQPFGHTRFLTNLIDFGMDPQAALDMGRVFARGPMVEVERSVPNETQMGLLALGHSLQVAPDPLGGGQAITIDAQTGILCAGSDPRKDGCALAY